jgi:hypothetical protein
MESAQYRQSLARTLNTSLRPEVKIRGMGSNPSLTPGTRRWYDRSSRYLALLALIITIVCTAITFFETTTNNGALKDLIVTCIGLIGAALALQLETLFRVTERTAARERYTKLLEGIEDYPDLLDLAYDALDASVRTLDKAQTPQLKLEVFNVFHHATSQLQELAQGRLRRAGSDNTLVLDRFAHAREFIRGTTDEGDTTWWGTDDGKKFLALNSDLIERGVRIERVWILATPPTPELLDMLEEHYKLRVEVFVVRADRRDLDRRLLMNFTLLDDDFLQMDVPNKEGQAVEYLYSENKVDIDRALNTFAQLKSKATRYVGPGSLDSVFR